MVPFERADDSALNGTNRPSCIPLLEERGSVHQTFPVTLSFLLMEHRCATVGHLSSQSDRLEKPWVLLGGAKYHTRCWIRETLRKLGVSVIYSGPYNYEAAPIELLFTGLQERRKWQEAPQAEKTPRVARSSPTAYWSPSMGAAGRHRTGCVVLLPVLAPSNSLQSWIGVQRLRLCDAAKPKRNQRWRPRRAGRASQAR